MTIEEMPTNSLFQDLTGQVFGRLTVMYYAEKRNNQACWLCRCKCGAEKIIRSSNLKSGHTKSCGCLKEQGYNRTHGRRHTPEYCSWTGMIQRCHNPKSCQYSHYGGRGIDVCRQWRNSFEAFFEDMGDRPSKEHTIDRIDNSKGYSPDNCKWATRKEQSRNRRSNRIVNHNGKSQTVTEWSEELGISYGAILARLNRGWSTEKALTTPVKN